MRWEMARDWLFAPQTLLSGLGILAILWMLCEYLRRKHKLRALFVGAGSGLAVLWLAHRYGAAIGFVPEGTVLEVAVAGVLGIPGVLLLAVRGWL